MPRRTVFFVSDGTGITAEMLGHSLLTQFEGIEFQQITLPFVNTPAKVQECVSRINAAARGGNGRPIVLTTLVNFEARAAIAASDSFTRDFFAAFLGPLEEELQRKSSHTMGRSHSAADQKGYNHRIDAVNFALAHDDGVTDRELEKAEVILVGVSRSGKTPTSLYLALQFGVRAANYPLIPEDFERMALPQPLLAYKNKLYGLSISPSRLREIRHERRPNSKYADPANCRYEVAKAEMLMRRNNIRWLDSTTKSIEEIATTIMQDAKLERRAF
jgi:regulator of PEP synthase PpsR (kinase-PPPase family)